MCGLPRSGTCGHGRHQHRLPCLRPCVPPSAPGHLWLRAPLNQLRPDLQNCLRVFPVYLFFQKSTSGPQTARTAAPPRGPGGARAAVQHEMICGRPSARARTARLSPAPVGPWELLSAVILGSGGPSHLTLSLWAGRGGGWGVGGGHCSLSVLKGDPVHFRK